MRIVQLLLLVGLMLLPVRASALTLDHNGCIGLAIWHRDVLWARDVGADKAKVKASIQEMYRLEPHPVFTLLLRNFDSLWATGMPGPAVMESVYKECVGRKGVYGDAT